MTARACLVVALSSEARPLVDRLGLRAVSPGGPFRLFRGPRAALVVSGVGKTLAAAATAFLFAAEGGRRDRPWINFGIAGHRDLEMGAGLLAHKVQDAGSGRVWYPCPLFDLTVPTSTVRTVDRVEREYPAGVASDMEAAGFVAAAARFSPSELVHVYKVVSDGPESDLTTLTASRVTELVAPHAEAVERLLAATCDLSAELDAARPSVDATPWLERWRFSVTQGRRLERLLARLAVVAARVPDPAELRPAPTDAGGVLEHLERSVNAAWSERG